MGTLFPSNINGKVQNEFGSALCDQRKIDRFVWRSSAVIVEGQRFDGVVVSAPESNASFAWAFAAPANVASWSILREKGEMKGFTNFLRRTRSQVPLATAMKPEAMENVTFQALNSTAWSPKERYILWFRFTDDTPAEFTIRTGFFPRPSLNMNGLPMLLFPAETK